MGHKIKETDRPTYFYRRENLKIIYRQEEDRWELYDLQEDPQELNNVIETASAAEEMKGVLSRRIDRQAK